MPRLSTAYVINEIKIQDTAVTEQLSLSQKKLARLRANLKAMRHEISDKLLSEMNDCRKYVSHTMDAIGEINVATQSKIK
jgi:hypothetical protein